MNLIRIQKQSLTRMFMIKLQRNLLPLVVSNCRHVRNSRSHRVDEVKEIVPFHQKASGIAYISNVEDSVHISRL